MKKRKTLAVVLASIAFTASLCVGVMGTHFSSGHEMDSHTEAREEIKHTSDSVYDEVSDLTLYDFRQSRTYGIGMLRTTFDEMDCIDFEGICGIKLSCDDQTVTYSAYTHTTSISENPKMYVYMANSDSPVRVRNLGTKKFNTDYMLNTSHLKDGLYYIKTDFTFKEKPVQAYAYFYIADGELKTCRVTNASQEIIDDEIDRWNHVMKDANPDDFLSNDKITYPTSGSGTAVVHTDEWEAVSDDIIVKDDWSDEMKVFAFVDYLAKNIAYDQYRAAQSNYASRATLNKSWNKDEMFTYGNHVGVCWDYTNILAIMCRHYDIPCTSVEYGSHTLNAVWLNEGWVAIDITMLARYECYDEDYDEENWLKRPVQHYGTWYGFYDREIQTFDDNIWTREKGLGIK